MWTGGCRSREPMLVTVRTFRDAKQVDQHAGLWPARSATWLQSDRSGSPVDRSRVSSSKSAPQEVDHEKHASPFSGGRFGGLHRWGLHRGDPVHRSRDGSPSALLALP